MNAVVKELDANYIDGMPNAEYHNPNIGVSASTIKAINADIGSVKWMQDAPQDEAKLKALDFGTDFHMYFLEPEKFAETYKVLPEFNRRKPAEKQAELDMIAQWKEDGIVAVTHEDMAKLNAMRDSALAHPTVAAIMSMNGVAERSIFWNDPKTGVKCKCRPDWLVADINNSNRLPFMKPGQTTLIADIKSIAQINRLQAQVEELKYYVQDAFYTRGVELTTKSKACFVFIAVSSSMEIGRHPVKVIKLADTARLEGRHEVDDALRKYADAANSRESWLSVVEMDRPHWADREDVFV